jgi:hypothetical protein
MVGMQARPAIGHNKFQLGKQLHSRLSHLNQRPTPQPALQCQDQCQAKEQYKRHQEQQRQELRQRQELFNRGLPFFWGALSIFCGVGDALRKKIKEIPRVKYTTKKYARKIHREYTQYRKYTQRNTPPGWEIHGGFFELQRTPYCIPPAAQSPQSGVLLWWFSLVVCNAA